MALKKTYLTNQINNSATISEKAGAAIDTDARGLIMKYDSNGDVVPATAGSVAIGVAIITNNEKISQGNDVDIQVKEIGLVRAGAAISKGAEIASNADGKAVTAAAGNFVVGIALEKATAADELIFMQFTKYMKPSA